MVTYWVKYLQDDGTQVTAPARSTVLVADAFNETPAYNIPYDPLGYHDPVACVDAGDGRDPVTFSVPNDCDYSGDSSEIRIVPGSTSEDCMFVGDFELCIRTCECEPFDLDASVACLEDIDGNPVTVTDVTYPPGIVEEDGNKLRADNSGGFGAQPISVTVQSSAGATQTFDININILNGAALGTGSMYFEDFKGIYTIDAALFGRGWRSIQGGNPAEVTYHDPNLDAEMWPAQPTPSDGDTWYNVISAQCQHSAGVFAVIFHGTDPGAPSASSWGLTDVTGIIAGTTTYIGPGASQGTYLFNVSAGEMMMFRKDSSFSANMDNVKFYIVPVAYEAEYTAQRDTGTYGWSDPTWWMNPDSNLFDPTFLEHIKNNYCHVRFMHASGALYTGDYWDGTDAQRPKMDWATWQNPEAVPYEFMVEMLNRSGGVDLYLNTYYQTYHAMNQGDPYYSNMAQYMKDNLQGKFIWGYANEVWNPGFPYNIAGNDLQTNGPCFGTEFATQTRFNNLGKRTKEISEVLHSVFDPDRECDLIVVLEQQTVFFNSAAWGLMNTSNTGCPVEDYTVNAAGEQRIDALMGTHYLRSSLRYPGQDNWQLVLDEINANFQNPFHPDVTALIASQVDDWLQNTVKPAAIANAGLAASKNLCYGTYEGGTHQDYNKPVANMTTDELFVWEAYWHFLQQPIWSSILLDYLNFHSDLPNAWRLNDFASVGVCIGQAMDLPQDGRPWDVFEDWDGSVPNVLGTVNANNQYNLASNTKK